jgi:hypothetical protein
MGLIQPMMAPNMMVAPSVMAPSVMAPSVMAQPVNPLIGTQSFSMTPGLTTPRISSTSSGPNSPSIWQGSIGYAGAPRSQPTSPVKSPGQAGSPAQQFDQFSKGVMMTALDPTEQDSDLMERLDDGVFSGSAAAGNVQLVSLGCSCGPKLSFKDIGRGAETLPFDWSRTKVEAVLNFIANDFAGFFDAPDKVQFTDKFGTPWTGFRSNMHSFWHDDPTVPAMRERYTRRIQRFSQIDATSKPVLFVRTVAHSNEIPRTGELLQLLQRKFGPQAMLLLVVDFQGAAAKGPFLVQGLNNLMVAFFDTRMAASQAAPYGDLVKQALSWIVGPPMNLPTLPNLATLHSMATPTDWGLYNANQPAFTL